MPDDHDPWNDLAQRHPRAQKLMAPELWDCVNEGAPFGSDEGADAYYEYRAWRSQNPNAPLVDCIAWIGDEGQYSDAFTFDATVSLRSSGSSWTRGASTPTQSHLLVRRSADSWKTLMRNAPPSYTRSKKQ